MDFNATIDLIIKDLNAASEIIDDLKKYPGVPALQVELAKSKCRSAGDVIALLKSISISVPDMNEPVHEKQFLQPSSKASDKDGSQLTPITEVKKKESGATGISSPISDKKPEPKVPAKKITDTPSVADKFIPKSDLYEEQMGSIKADNDVSDHLKPRQVASISDAIGISDKFLFMGEIFDGNKEAYTQALTRLDKAENLEDAMAIIMSYTGENTENPAVSQLLELVKLKLSSNE